MSGVNISRFGHKRTHSKSHIKDFTVATPEEFVKRFGGDRVINKVSHVVMLRCRTYISIQVLLSVVSN